MKAPMAANESVENSTNQGSSFRADCGSNGFLEHKTRVTTAFRIPRSERLLKCCLSIAWTSSTVSSSAMGYRTRKAAICSRSSFAN